MPASPSDTESIKDSLSEFCDAFGYDIDAILDTPFTVVTPDSKNPYKQMYVAN